jgi:polyphosphate kinase
MTISKRNIPVLTPLAFDPGRPFPYISNLSLSLAVLIRSPKRGRIILPVVKVSQYSSASSSDDKDSFGGKELLK